MIKLTNVTVRYGDHVILRDVNLDLKPGSFHFLTGPSGSGKSTLLKALTMDVRVSAGTVRMLDQDVTEASPEQAARIRRWVGVVLQDSPLLDHVDVFTNVAVPLVVLGRKLKDYAEDVRDLLEWLDLKDQVRAEPKTLSAGQRQRVGLARAVIGRPAVMLADEPTANLDPVMARRTLRLFIELNRLGTTVLFATHDLRLMKAFKAPRIVLKNGTAKIEAGS